MHQITINVTDEELQKLDKLAKYRRKTIEECIREFIRIASPGGSGWQPPEKASK